MSQLTVVMLGPPGAGKGTQSTWLARDYGLLKIATGDILRDDVSHGTPLGDFVRATMASGRLVPDETMVQIVAERLRRPDAAAGVILDGFPRTVPQARALDEISQDRGVLTVLLIEVPFEELVRRLQSRRICDTCGVNAEPGQQVGQKCPKCGGSFVSRIDDEDEVVRKRLTIYHDETEPLVDYYRGSRTFFRINGNLAPSTVTAQIRDALDTSRAVGRKGDQRVDVRP
jgi:adenylate kinase